MIETVSEIGDSLITGTSYEQNIHSDSEFCKEYLSGRPEGAEAEIMITDGVYSGKGNQELSAPKIRNYPHGGYYIDDISTLGYLRSRQFFCFKIGAYNFNKLLRHNIRQRVESVQNLAIT